MQRIPYTYSQAQALCKKLQVLKGNIYDLHNNAYGEVECVAISPFDQANKKKFLFYYLLSGNAELALHEEYKGLLYDVVVIARSANDPNDLVQEDVKTWMDKNNITPDFFSDGADDLQVMESTIAYMPLR